MIFVIQGINLFFVRIGQGPVCGPVRIHSYTTVRAKSIDNLFDLLLKIC